MLGGTLLVALVGYGAFLAWRAHRDLVTLDVRNMDVRDVVKKIEWQTWEDIYVHQDVQGQVTLKVAAAPLSEVLRIIGGQTLSRPAMFYALYSGRKSFRALEQSLSGEVDPATHGWTNLAARPFGFGAFGGGGPGGMFVMGMPGGPAQSSAPPETLSLNITGKDIDFATLAFGRFGQLRVVPEDGVTQLVNLVLHDASPEKAVAGLAKSVKRDWVAVYALQGGMPRGGPPEGGGERVRPPRDDSNTNAPRRGFRPEISEAQREEMRKQREEQEEQLKQALPPVERAKYEQAQQEREATLREFQNMSPEQMRERFASQNRGGIDRMMRERVLNTTPEQRRQMDRPRNQSGPGGGGPSNQRR